MYRCQYCGHPEGADPELRAENERLKAQLEDENSTRYKYKAECLERANEKLLAENERLSHLIGNMEGDRALGREFVDRLQRELLETRATLELRTEALEYYAEGNGNDETDSEWIKYPSGPCYGMDHYGVRARKALLPSCATPILDAVREAVEALNELQISHEHNETNPDYRPLSDTHGWCSGCTAKVGLNEDIARDALAKLRGAVGK